MNAARTPTTRFPVGSIRHAVAVFGDNWGLIHEPPIGSLATNPAFAAERHDAEIMQRCSRPISERGSMWDPRVWIGVPLTERAA